MRVTAVPLKPLPLSVPVMLVSPTVAIRFIGSKLSAVK